MANGNKKNKQLEVSKNLPQIITGAAGSDVGSREIFVCLPEECPAPRIRKFQVFTQDLVEMANWLCENHVETIALEATGVYWIPIYDALESAKIKVCLLNPRNPHNVSGHKDDVADCQWIQWCHSVGVTQASFRPNEQVVAIRAIMRHRQSLIEDQTRSVLRMQKALTQMNIQLHHAISDITGKSGLAIIDAIIAGERDPKRLADLCDRGIKTPKDVIIKSLEGNWRQEHIHVLSQSRVIYACHQQWIHESDATIEAMLREYDEKNQIREPEGQLSKTRQRASKNAVVLPNVNLREQMFRIYGTDLTEVPGLQATSVLKLFTEIGPNLDAFPTAGHFCNWLGLSPNQAISGGKVLHAHTRPVNNRAAATLRVSIHGILSTECHLTHFYRRMSYKVGKRGANTATAHKLARILYHLITTRRKYDESAFARAEQAAKDKHHHRIKQYAARHGYQLVPIQN
jgi:transposase